MPPSPSPPPPDGKTHDPFAIPQYVSCSPPEALSQPLGAGRMGACPFRSLAFFSPGLGHCALLPVRAQAAGREDTVPSFLGPSSWNRPAAVTGDPSAVTCLLHCPSCHVASVLLWSRTPHDNGALSSTGFPRAAAQNPSCKKMCRVYRL